MKYLKVRRKADKLLGNIDSQFHCIPHLRLQVSTLYCIFHFLLKLIMFTTSHLHIHLFSYLSCSMWNPQNSSINIISELDRNTEYQPQIRTFKSESNVCCDPLIIQWTLRFTDCAQYPHISAYHASPLLINPSSFYFSSLFLFFYAKFPSSNWVEMLRF